MLPFLFLLIDFQKRLERLFIAHRAAQLEENFLGAVEQACLQVIQPEFGQRVQAPVIAQALAIHQVLMHPDRPVGFAAAAEQATQSEMQIDRFRIDLGRLEECLDGPIRLLVEQKVQPLEIGAGQGARFAQQVLEVDPRGDPAE